MSSDITAHVCKDFPLDGILETHGLKNEICQFFSLLSMLLEYISFPLLSCKITEMIHFLLSSFLPLFKSYQLKRFFFFCKHTKTMPSRVGVSLLNIKKQSKVTWLLSQHTSHRNGNKKALFCCCHTLTDVSILHNREKKIPFNAGEIE